MSDLDRACERIVRAPAFSLGAAARTCFNRCSNRLAVPEVSGVRSMGSRIRRGLALIVVVLAAGCHREAPVAVKDKPQGLGPSGDDAIPAAALDAVLAAHLKGLGHMERYEYDQAVQAF